MTSKLRVTDAREWSASRHRQHCTHAGCSLGSGELDDTVVTCACHGSRFDVATGDVLRGPAQRAVRRRAVSTSGDDVLVEAWTAGDWEDDA